MFEWRKSACFKVWCGNVVDPCLVSSEYPSIICGNVAARPRTVISRLVVIVWDIIKFLCGGGRERMEKIGLF